MFLREYKANRQPDLTVLIGMYCPACRFEHGFRVDEVYWAQEGKDCWTFNGDFEKPTFRASMPSKFLHDSDDPRRLCHSFMTDGVWEFLGDCTHEMVGQKVPMIPYPEEYYSDRYIKDG